MLIVSLISSFTTNLVALLVAYFGSKYQKQNYFLVEELKMNLELKKKEYEIIQRIKDEHDESIQMALEISQKIKDSFLLLWRIRKHNISKSINWQQAV